MKLNCTIGALIRSAIRTVLLRHGCTESEANSVEVHAGADHGAGSSLASVRSSDGRELYRVYDLEDVDGLLRNEGDCGGFVAKVVRRLSRIQQNHATS